MRRFVALFSAFMLVGSFAAAGLSPSVVRAAVPSEHQQVLWQHVCEDAAQGTVIALVPLDCRHSGFPMWSDAATKLLERVCERAVGGTYQYRSQYPSEFAVCWLD
jgi:hypothetical protein